MEIWKDVVGYEGVYQVSSYGRVKRIGAAPGAQVGRILKLQFNPSNGGMQVRLCWHSKHTTEKVHRLVAEAFLDKPTPEHNEVNHKNGNRKDNRVENLEWVTRSENIRHSYDVLGRKRSDLRGEQIGNSKLTRKEVKQIRALYSTGEWTQEELAEKFGVSQVLISKIVRGELWSHIPGICDTSLRKRGEGRPLAKLTGKKAKQIRRLYASGDHSQSELAKRFDVSQYAVSKVVRRITWRHVK